MPDDAGHPDELIAPKYDSSGDMGGCSEELAARMGGFVGWIVHNLNSERLMKRLDSRIKVIDL